MSFGTSLLPAAANKPGSAAAETPSVSRGVLLWGAAVVMTISAALGAWWASSSDDAAAATSVQAVPSAATAAVVVPLPASAARVTSHPREQCAGRHLIALHRCLVRQCEKPEFQAHRECERVREIEARTRSVLGD